MSKHAKVSARVIHLGILDLSSENQRNRRVIGGGGALGEKEFSCGRKTQKEFWVVGGSYPTPRGSKNNRVPPQDMTQHWLKLRVIR